MNMSRNLKVLFGAFALTATVASARAEVVTEDLVNPDNPEDIWGQKITGLGETGDETALVFTKTGETLNWTMDKGVTAVRFLAVGGGGGGGGGMNNAPAGGGGAGGLAKGTMCDLPASTVVAIEVGAGGAGGAGAEKSGNQKSGAKGNDSKISVGDTLYVQVYGGGGGGGYSKNGEVGGCGGGAGGAYSGSGCGSGGSIDGYSAVLNESYVSGETYGNVGGNGYSGKAYGAGGGGATAAGGNATSSKAGSGGAGLSDDITGAPVTYAAGGAGVAGAWSGSAPEPAANNTGNGGKGATNKKAGGNGGSGIVVIRYREMAANEIPVPTIAGKTYTGELQKADIVDGEGYTVTKNEGGINAGDYEVILTLVDGYQWVGGSTAPAKPAFTIAKAENVWTTEPSLSTTAWELDGNPASVNAGAALSETAVVVTYDEGETKMPLTVGDHTTVFTVVESQNYLGLSKTINYTVNKNTNGWIVEPSMTKTTWAFDDGPGEIVGGEAKYGDVVVTYDDDPEITKLPTDKGSHTVKFAVAGTDTYTGLEKVVDYTVTKKQHNWIVPPNPPAMVNIEDGVNFPMPVAESGVEVKAYFDGDPEKTDLTELSVGESHSVTYEIAGDDDWDALKETFPFTVTYKPIVDPEDPTNEYGYRVPGLGENKDEIALVFTKTGETLKWIPDLDYANVQFLVVGGGGGGGGFTGGGGGGGGGVVTGSINQVSKQIPVSIVVGAGGKGGAANGAAGQNGGASSVSVADSALVKAYGGDRGYGKKTDKTASGIGSGGGGSCGFVGNDNAFGGIFDESCVTAVAYGCAGGSGVSGGSYAGAGGGGALEAGAVPSSDSIAGGGGEGLACDILDVSDVFGSGGGGGMGKTGTVGQGGTNAGRGVGRADSSGRDGKANRGGGGGGGGGNADSWHGGQGGSGIVVLRYVKPAGVAPVPTIGSKAYTGEILTADVPVDPGYIVTSNEGGVNVGDYDVVLTLVSGYRWDGGSTEPTNLAFTITQAQNEWTVEPSIDKTTWLTTDDPGELTAGETQFGTPTATISKDGGDAEPFDGTLPTAAGQYVITYTVETGDNWLDPEVTKKSVSFEIVSGDVVPPFTVTKGETTTVVGDGKVDLSIGYAVHCEVESDKTVDIYAYIAEDGADTTNEVKIAEDVALDAVGTGVVPDLKPGVTYWVALDGRGGETVAPTTEFTAVTMTGPATGLTASATFTNDPKEFVITGSVTPGLGTTTVYVRWSLNSSALDQSAAFPFSYGDAGAFTQKVAYAELIDKLTWDVVVSNNFTSTTYGEQKWDAAFTTNPKDRFDSSPVTYTWTGNGGDNRWLNIANWSANKTENFGYPDSGNATAKFEKSWAIDLCGGTFALAKGTGLTVGTYDYMVFSNGTIQVDFAKDADFGAANTTIVFKDATLERDRLSPVANATVAFEGAARFTGMVRPWGASGEKMNFLNGENITIGKILCGGAATGREMTISNATVTLQGSMASAYGSATFPVTLQNGPDRQARLVSSHADGWDFVQSPYTLTIPEQPYAAPYFQATKVRGSVNSSPTFKIDVTNWKRGKRVPILTFTSSASGAATQYGGATVKAYENGVDVTAKRNARLEWDADTRTLYYKQDSQGGFALIVK